jgi:hypothetical protein
VRIEQQLGEQAAYRTSGMPCIIAVLGKNTYENPK